MVLKRILLVCVIFVSLQINAQTIFARASGDWDQTTVWSTIGTGGASCGCIPGPGDDVLIDGFDVDIDAGTGDVTVNSVEITNASGTDVRLRVQAGAVLTVSTNFEIANNFATSDSELTVNGGSGLEVLGNFIGDQDAGDDLLIDIDDNAIVNIAGTTEFFQDGGDDFELNINQNSGTAAQWNVVGDFIINHNEGDDYRVRVDDVSSLLTVGGDLILNLNGGTDDDLNFNLDEGAMNITGDILVTRALEYGLVLFDLDGGDINCTAVEVNSSGVLFSLGAVHFIIDGVSVFNCDSFTSNFTGADDLYIHLNQNIGTTAAFNVVNDLTITRSAGDDIEILIGQSGELNVGGNFSIVSSGPDSEELEIILSGNGVFDVTGNCTINIIDGEDVGTNTHIVRLEGAGSSPSFNVGGAFSWTSSINIADCDIEVNGGLFSVMGDMTLTQNAGAEDFDFDIDDVGAVTVGGDFNFNLNGGDDVSFNLGTDLVGSTGSFTVDGNCTLTHNTATVGSVFDHDIIENSRFTVNGDLNLVSNFPASSGITQLIQNTAEVQVSGNVVFTTTAANELEINVQNDAFFKIRGGFVRGAAPNAFGELATSDNATVTYNGTIAQVIAEDAGSGGDSFTYTNLEINNTFGTAPQLTLEGIVTVNGDLTMNDGVVASNATVILIVANDGTSSNASNNSYVDGYMRKTGDDAFVFPCGNGGFYGPMAIAAPAAAADQFEAQYFHTDPDADGFDASMIDPTLDHISSVEYWKLERTAGASTPIVTLSWDTPRSGGVDDEADLRFARWDGAIWRDLGAASVVGTPISGTFENNIAIGAFSDNNPFTLASITGTTTLPIELLAFNATMETQGVQLKWETASEINNDYFTVERSTDGLNWETIIRQFPAAGNSSELQFYSVFDYQTFNGVVYYRLSQTDFDGAQTLFDPVSVYKEREFLVYPNPANQSVTVISSSKVASLQVYDLRGVLMDIETLITENGLELKTESLPNGVYNLVLDEVVVKLVVQH